MKVLTDIITLSLTLFLFSVPEVLGSEAVAVVSVFCLNNHIRKIIIHIIITITYYHITLT